jgi:hypothetical protein
MHKEKDEKYDKCLKPFRNLLKIDDGKIDCPLYGHDVLPVTACQNCQYFEGYRSNDEKVVCTYHKIEKTAATYPFSGQSKFVETIMPGGDKDSAMSLMRQVRNPNDITSDELESPIARDKVGRDIEPDFEKIADYFGFNLDELKQEIGL